MQESRFFVLCCSKRKAWSLFSMTKSSKILLGSSSNLYLLQINFSFPLSAKFCQEFLFASLPCMLDCLQLVYRPKSWCYAPLWVEITSVAILFIQNVVNCQVWHARHLFQARESTILLPCRLKFDHAPFGTSLLHVCYYRDALLDIESTFGTSPTSYII